MKKLLLFLPFLMNFSCNTLTNTEVLSPSENLKLKIDTEISGLKLEILTNNKKVLDATIGNFVFSNNAVFSNYKITSVTEIAKKETWHPVYGEKNTIENNYNEVTLSLERKEQPTQTLKVVCRVYNEGVAFKYLFDENENLIITRELISFNLDKDYDSWVTEMAQGNYKKIKIGKLKNVVERPLVIKKNDTSYIAIGEAALVDYARMKLSSDSKNQFSLITNLAGNVDLKKAKYTSPWRFVMVGKSPGELLEHNYFLENLNEPNKIDDVSWIKPGKVIREVTLTTVGAKACIDFAVKHNLQYIEFDAGWYGHEYDDAEDATTITVDPDRSPGPLNLQEAIAYGKEKGIGVILYINQRAMSKQLDQVLPLYQSWGVAGVKYGFVNVGSQEWTIWLHNAVRKAAKYHLMVDIHDEYRPTGYSRTYPNLMTQEGIRGDEESPTVTQSITTLFTRMIAGAGDNTNCYLAERVSETMGGKTAQMAKSIMLYSPWQFLYWYDRPNNSLKNEGKAGDNNGVLKDSEDLSFFDLLPTVWDETKVLESDMEDFATIVRRNGDTWFLGSLAANKDRTLNIAFNFLNEGDEYEAVLYSQDAKALKNNKVNIEKFSVDHNFLFNKELQKDSGLAIIISKK